VLLLLFADARAGERITAILACPQADPAKLQELKKLRETNDPSSWPRLSSKNSSAFTNCQPPCSPSLEILQQTSQPLTRAERQAVLEISELLGINVRIATQKTNQRKVTS
jgi:dsDNA-specific endonuclease/ATPase MutS2